MVTFLPLNDWMFQLANTFLALSYMGSSLLYLRTVLMLASLFFVLWAWFTLAVAIDTVLWNAGFMVINLVQILRILYQMRPIDFHSEELEGVYQALFGPGKYGLPRLDFRMLTDAAFIRTLNAGSTYVDAGSRAHYLSILISGDLGVYGKPDDDGVEPVLGVISAFEFLDSAQWVSRATEKGNTFNVTIRAMSPCRYIMWPRENLERLFKDMPHLSSCIDSIIGNDLAKKLFGIDALVEHQDDIDGVVFSRRADDELDVGRFAGREDLLHEYHLVSASDGPVSSAQHSASDDAEEHGANGDRGRDRDGSKAGSKDAELRLDVHSGDGAAAAAAKRSRRRSRSETDSDVSLDEFEDGGVGAEAVVSESGSGSDGGSGGGHRAPNGSDGTASSGGRRTTSTARQRAALMKRISAIRKRRGAAISMTASNSEDLVDIELDDLDDVNEQGGGTAGAELDPEHVEIDVEPGPVPMSSSSRDLSAYLIRARQRDAKSKASQGRKRGTPERGVDDKSPHQTTPKTPTRRRLVFRADEDGEEADRADRRVSPSRSRSQSLSRSRSREALARRGSFSHPSRGSRKRAPTFDMHGIKRTATMNIMHKHLQGADAEMLEQYEALMALPDEIMALYYSVCRDIASLQDAVTSELSKETRRIRNKVASVFKHVENLRRSHQASIMDEPTLN